MRAMLLTLGAAALLVRVVITLPNADASTGPIPLNCIRACLAGLPLSKDVVYTENNKIRRVEMVGNSTPHHTNSPWPGNLSGN